MKSKEDLLTISPMEDYKVPEMPTYEENKPDLTSKLPSRWKNKAMIAVMAGVLGANALTGCTMFEQEVSIPDACGEEEHWGLLNNFQHDLCVRSHFGGAVGSPIYIAHLTEQEVFWIISDRLEAVGLNFEDNSPPGYYADGFWQDTTIDLFDSRLNIGIIQLSWIDSNGPFSSRGRELTRLVAEAFTNQEHDITVGVFDTPGYSLGWDSSQINARYAAEIRSDLLDDIDEQIQDFIDQLQEKGIID